MDPQVSDEHYTDGYDDLMRFISYFYQVDLTRKLAPTKILYIGVGNKTVETYLRNNHYDVVTCDIDKRLKPDYVADVRHLPFRSGKFDLVLAFQILEHIPWKDVGVALKQIAKVTSKYAIISLPYSSTGFELVLRFPLIEKLLQVQLLNFSLRVPHFLRRAHFSGEHYWELGMRNFSKERFRRLVKEDFVILREVTPVLNTYHHFFILEKR